MTNKEKYQEVFGFEPDEECCPTVDCEECPAKSEYALCPKRWWNSEYRGNDK